MSPKGLSRPRSLPVSAYYPPSRSTPSAADYPPSRSRPSSAGYHPCGSTCRARSAPAPPQPDRQELHGGVIKRTRRRHRHEGGAPAARCVGWLPPSDRGARATLRLGPAARQAARRIHAGRRRPTVPDEHYTTRAQEQAGGTMGPWQPWVAPLGPPPRLWQERGSSGTCK
jgi:hypothetical protein